MKRLPPSIVAKYVAALRPHLLERQAFTAVFSDYQAASIIDGTMVLNEPFSEYDHITSRFLAPVRPAVQSVRGFARFLSTKRNRRFEALIDKKGRGNVFKFDHSSDVLFDARQVLAGMTDTGLRLVFSFDSSRADLPLLLSALWNPQVLANPATKIGASAVRHAKDIPGGSPVIRFIMTPGAYQPEVLIYGAPDRITGIFRLATRHSHFTRQVVRGLVTAYGKAKTQAA
jgi:hypothetical protein